MNELEKESLHFEKMYFEETIKADLVVKALSESGVTLSST